MTTREIVLLECAMCGAEMLGGEEGEMSCDFCGSADLTIVVYRATETQRQEWDGD